jgi:hypothetical protein
MYSGSQDGVFIFLKIVKQAGIIYSVMRLWNIEIKVKFFVLDTMLLQDLLRTARVV